MELSVPFQLGPFCTGFPNDVGDDNVNVIGQYVTLRVTLNFEWYFVHQVAVSFVKLYCELKNADRPELNNKHKQDCMTSRHYTVGSV